MPDCDTSNINLVIFLSVSSFLRIRFSDLQKNLICHVVNVIINIMIQCFNVNRKGEIDGLVMKLVTEIVQKKDSSSDVEEKPKSKAAKPQKNTNGVASPKSKHSKPAAKRKAEEDRIDDEIEKSESDGSDLDDLDEVIPSFFVSS